MSWRIPLQHRVGNGYVFSSRFQGDEDARASLIAGMDGPPTADPRLIRFTPGARKRSWIGNVVAIGLSSGFLEPLESTSIHLIQSGIAKLLALFPARDCSPLLADQFNRVFGQEMEDVRDFLILHYHHTAGRTEPMWLERQAMEIPETLASKIAHFEQSGRIVISTDELFRGAGRSGRDPARLQPDDRRGEQCRQSPPPRGSARCDSGVGQQDTMIPARAG